MKSVKVRLATAIGAVSGLATGLSLLMGDKSTHVSSGWWRPISEVSDKISST